MVDEEIAFQLMRLYRTLRGPGDGTVKDAARREIDCLLRQIDWQMRASPASSDRFEPSRLPR